MARKPPTVDASLGKQVRRAKDEALDHEETQPKIAEAVLARAVRRQSFPISYLIRHLDVRLAERDARPRTDRPAGKLVEGEGLEARSRREHID